MSTASVPAKRLGNRAFGLAVAAVFGAMGGIGWLLAGRILDWAFVSSGFLIVVALLAPGLLMPLNRLWALFGQRIGIVSNHLVLGLFFYLLITPIGGLLRLFRRDPFPKHPDATAKSYWTQVGRKTTSETYADLF